MAISSTQEFINTAKSIHGDRYIYSKAIFEGLNKRIIITCKVHGDYQTTPWIHLRGSNCIKCTGKARGTTESFIAKARAKHGDRYDYSKVDYKTNRTKVCIICPDHGEFWQAPANHINLGAGCPTCAGCKRLTLDEFIRRSRQAHGDQYDYSMTVFTNVDTKVKIICPKHGPFEQIAYDHMKGHGCSKCGAEKCADSCRHDSKKFIVRARERFGQIFDYSKVDYINSETKVEIICPAHGPFLQRPYEHLTGTGCPLCSSVAPVSRDEFISRAMVVHSDIYDYTQTNYSAMHRKCKIICKKHGEFLTLPKDHLAKSSGCPRCARENAAGKDEKELANWIESFGLRVIRNDREVLNGLEIDIYLPDLMIGIECHGAYWHQDNKLVHPRSHETKSLLAKSKGIRLLTVWDFDWNKNRKLVQSHIMHQLRINQANKINARNCTIITIDSKAASVFYAQTHIQGAAWRAIANYALLFKGNIVACMSFSQGSSRRGKSGQDEWELLRFSTDGIVRGGASRLFSAFVRNYRPEIVWSFSDRQHFDGNLYPKLGFQEDGQVAADYRVYHQGKDKIWHKSAWQRRHIPTRLAELGITDHFDPETDPRTEREMQALARCIRIMDSGKIRWKWTHPT